jgi:hypothetical protein
MAAVVLVVVPVRGMELLYDDVDVTEPLTEPQCEIVKHMLPVAKAPRLTVVKGSKPGVGLSTVVRAILGGCGLRTVVKSVAELLGGTEPGTFNGMYVHVFEYEMVVYVYDV